MDADNNKIIGQIPQNYAGMRLDRALAKLYPDHSRSTIQKWLKGALVSVDDEILPQKQRINGGESVEIQLPQKQAVNSEPQDIDIEIVYEDTDVIVLNKQAGLVVHPGAGNRDGTLLNALLYHDRSLSDLPRAGIVHRLDKLTSGLMVVARNETTRLKLVEQLQSRQVSRQYLALVCGVPISGGTVNAAIGRHFSDRKRMAVNDSGKQAISHYRVKEKYRHHGLVRVRLETGRTHQIRVHMQHIGYPVLGDPVYGQRLSIPNDACVQLVDALRSFKRQALHAEKLSFTHPATGAQVTFEQPMPLDMSEMVELLRHDHRKHA